MPTIRSRSLPQQDVQTRANENTRHARFARYKLRLDAGKHCSVPKSSQTVSSKHHFLDECTIECIYRNPDLEKLTPTNPLELLQTTQTRLRKAALLLNLEQYFVGICQ